MSIDIGTIYANLQIRNAGQVQAEVSKVNTVIQNFQRSMQIAAGVLMRDVFYGFIGVIREATELGAEVETLKNSFESFTDAAGAQWLTLDRLRTATQGMVSDVDLLTQANRMLSAGMPVDQIEELFDGAIKLGKAMGIDASMAIEKLTLGLVRQSWRLMDDLGIIMRASQAYEEYAESIGTTVDQLDAQQKQLAWIIYGTREVTERVKVLGDNIGETDKMMSQFAATMMNLKTAIGENLTALPAITTLINALAPAIGIIVATQFANMATAAAKAGAALTGLQSVMAAGAAIAPWAAAATVILLLPVAIRGYGMALHDLRMNLDEAYAAQQRVKDSAEALADAEMALEQAAVKHMTAQQNANSTYSSLLQAIDAYGDALKRQEQLEEDLERAQRSKTVAYTNFVAALAYAKGETDFYRDAQEDLTWSTKEAELVYAGLRSTLWGLQDEYRALSDEMRGLEDQHRSLTDQLYEMGEADEETTLKMMQTRLEMDKLRVAYKEGKIGEEEYERKMGILQLSYDKLNLKQDKSRINQFKLQDQTDDLGREIELLGRTMDETSSDIDSVTNQIDVLKEKDDALEQAVGEVLATTSDLTEATTDLGKAFTEVQSALDTYKASQFALADAYGEQWTNMKLAEMARDALTAANKRAFEEELRQKLERDSWEEQYGGQRQEPYSDDTTPPMEPTIYGGVAGRNDFFTPQTNIVYSTRGREEGDATLLKDMRVYPPTATEGTEIHFHIGTFVGLNESAARELASAAATYYIRELERMGVKL
jgi:hypothetical protein